MMHRAQRLIATSVFMLSLLVAASMTAPAAAQDADSNDLRDIRLGKPVTDLPDAGYVNFACASDPGKTLTTWLGWRDCPADALGYHAIKFGYDPVTSQDGTIVAGHPAVLTLLVDNAGTVSGLRIETDPKARLYLRKKAFLFGIQVRSRYGLDDWSCTQAQPNAGEQPVGGVYVRERCTKTTHDRSIVVERNLFRRPDQDMKNFVDETRMTILRTKN
jgi:hypothetical protein